jgi:hypothetical protein
MKKYTQEEFDALPLVDGVRQCPTGDYTQIMNFGAWCSFGEGCSFGAWCSFGEGCRFGKGCSFEGDHKALAGYPILSFGGGGLVNRTVYAFNVENGPLVRAGCFVGTLDAFRAKVRRDDDRLKSLQYLGFANIVAATWCPERIEK